MVLIMVLTSTSHISHKQSIGIFQRDDDVDDKFDNGDYDSVEDGADDGVDDGVVGADKHLTHLSQAVN
eukprot:9434761-Ditylum_brightwellii.AAC.1